MKQIRENVFYVTHSELGKPDEKGIVDVPDFGSVQLDIADLRYIREYLEKGYEPAFFVARSPAMGGRFIVVSRHRAA
jgi:hypothetical protein